MGTNVDGKAFQILLPPSLSLEQAPQLNLAVGDGLAQGASRFVADASATTYINSSGIGLLIQLQKDIQARNGELVMSNLTGEPLAIFLSAGLDRVFQIASDDDSGEALPAASPDESPAEASFQFAQSGSVGIFKLSGLISGVEVLKDLEKEILAKFEATKKFLLDFQDLSYLDSMAVGGIMNIYKQINSVGGEMRMCGANEIVMDLLQILNIENIIPYFPSPQQALADW